MRTVAAGVQIRAATEALVSKAHALGRAQRDLVAAGVALHDGEAAAGPAAPQRGHFPSNHIQLDAACSDMEAMPDAKDAPILSRLADDPSVGDAIDGFVVNLAERVDALQDCEMRSALSELSESARALGADAAEVGFDTLSAAARSIREACGRDAAADARKAVEELTEMARRIRLGHRGAV